MRKSLFILPLLYWLITIILLVLPGDELPKAKLFQFNGLDKIIHTIMFFLLTYLFCRLIYKLHTDNKQRLKGFMQVMILAIVYGILMEFVQKFFVPYRSFEMADIAVDTLGAVLGYFVSIKMFLSAKAV